MTQDRRPNRIHEPADPIGDVQDCARCGLVLVDNRGVVGSPSTGGSRYFEPRTGVVWWGGGVSITRDAPNCGVQDERDGGPAGLGLA